MRLTRRTFAGFAVGALLKPAFAGETFALVRHDKPQAVPAIMLETRAGEAVTLDSQRGKFTVLHLWASWCASCRTEFPSLIAFDAAFRPRQVALVTVSLDRNGWPVVNRTLQETSAQALPVFLDRDRAILSALKVRGLPTSLVLDGEGREIARVTGPLEWTAPAVASYFDSLLA